MWTFRERRAEDLPRCVEVLHEVHLTDRYRFRWPADPESWLSPDHLLQAWIVEDETGSIAGHVALTSTSPGHAHVERLFAARTAIGSGIGRRLLELSLQRAAKDGLRLTLEVADNGTAAIDLYRRSGWTETGRVGIDWGAGGPRELLTFTAPGSAQEH